MSQSEQTNRLALANELITALNGELEKRQEPKTALEQLQRSALQGLRKELETLSQLLAITRHRLVFIGQVAVGKTTVICHLVGLTAERDKKKKLSKTGPEKLFRVTEDLMATGSGFTTLCEVVVTPADKNRFEVEPYENQEVERTISDFCQTIWKKVYPDGEDSGQKTGGSSEQVNFPPELVRAVRNMVKLPGGDRREDDPAVRLAQEFPREGFEQFRSKVLSNAKLEARTQTEFLCPSGDPDPRAWIKKTFDDLNLAQLDTVSIPRRITLHVQSSLLAPNMSLFEAVIDTKGVDAAQFNRADLDRFIRDDPSALCILVERFESAPTNTIPLLQRHVTREAPLSSSKFVLLVVPRASEPDKVVAGRGQVGDRDTGIEVRRSQIEETVSSQGIPQLDERLVFFDPLWHFEPIGNDFQLRQDSDPAEVQADRDKLWDALCHAITMRHNQVGDRVTHIGDSIRKIREGKGLDRAEEDLVRQAKAKITEYRHLTLANSDRFLELYRGNWEGPNARQHMILRATNNRYGVYPYRNIDIYYDAIPITEQLVRTAAVRPKADIIEIVRDVRTRAPEESDLQELFNVLETRIDSLFEEFVRAVGATMHDYLSEQVFYPRDSDNVFWINVQDRYGKGPGYRDDVLSMYADELQAKNHEEFLTNTAEDCWQRILMDPILEYLG